MEISDEIYHEITEKIVEDNKQLALLHPLTENIIKAPGSDVTGKTTFEIDGIKFSTKLTCNQFPPRIDVWHLSISPQNVEHLPDELVEKVKKAYFGDCSDVLEIPSVLYTGQVRQFWKPRRQ